MSIDKKTLILKEEIHFETPREITGKTLIFKIVSTFYLLETRSSSLDMLKNGQKTKN